MHVIYCAIDGEPVAKGRPRATLINKKFISMYTDKKTKDYEKKVGETYRECGYPIFDGPIRISICFVHQIPKSTKKADKEKMLNKEIYPTKNDLDNCIKCLTDGLNKIAYNDDRQIVHINATKEYGLVGYTKFSISEVAQ